MKEINQENSTSSYSRPWARVFRIGCHRGLKLFNPRFHTTPRVSETQHDHSSKCQKDKQIPWQRRIVLFLVLLKTLSLMKILVGYGSLEIAKESPAFVESWLTCDSYKHGCRQDKQDCDDITKQTEARRSYKLFQNFHFYQSVWRIELFKWQVDVGARILKKMM